MQALLRSAARPWVRTLLSAATLVVLSATAQAQTILRWAMWSVAAIRRYR